MELTEDFRLTSTPRSLLIGCIILLTLRIGLSIFEWQHPINRGRTVAWQDAAVSQEQPADGKKLRLYEFYADWCSPCQRLERDVMSNDEIRDTIESNFQAIRVVDKQREEGKNPKWMQELQKKYRVFAFPTLVAVAPDGEAIGSLVGNSSSLSVYRFLSRTINDAAKKAK
ncbi:MAG: thioredoxin family protein [Candidatus Obscuribacterales bacterium]|nr:thioredoxin family protein [Candidatus Obscuribacterales bacterium]